MTSAAYTEVDTVVTEVVENNATEEAIISEAETEEVLVAVETTTASAEDLEASNGELPGENKHCG